MGPHLESPPYGRRQPVRPFGWGAATGSAASEGQGAIAAEGVYGRPPFPAGGEWTGSTRRHAENGAARGGNHAG